MLKFAFSGRNRWRIPARNSRAYVWQNGRFPGDEAFWTEKLGPEAKAEPVKRDLCLRFFLRTVEDFQTFRPAATCTTSNFDFTTGPVEDGSEENELNA